MPIFEYHCLNCNCDFEKLIRGKSASIVCPGCHSKKIEKQLSVFGFKSEDRFTSSSSAKKSCSTCSAVSCNTCE